MARIAGQEPRIINKQLQIVTALVMLIEIQTFSLLVLGHPQPQHSINDLEQYVGKQSRISRNRNDTCYLNHNLFTNCCTITLTTEDT